MLRVLYPIPNAFKSLSKRRLIGIDRKMNTLNMAFRSKGDRHTQAYKKHILYNQVPTSIKLFIHIVIKFVPYQSTLGLMILAARASAQVSW